MALHFLQRGESQDELLVPPEDNSGCGFQVLSPRDCAGPVSPNTFVPPSLRSLLPLGYARRPGERWQLTRGLTPRPPCLATQGHGVPKRMVLFVLISGATKGILWVPCLQYHPNRKPRAHVSALLSLPGNSIYTFLCLWSPSLEAVPVFSRGC